MQHPAIRVHTLRCFYDFCDREVDVVRVADAGSDATEACKRGMYSILSKYGAQNCIRCIGTTCPYHVCWVNVFYISVNTNALEMHLNLLLHVNTNVTKYYISRCISCT